MYDRLNKSIRSRASRAGISFGTLFFLFFVLLSSGISQVVGGTLSGVITDPSGAALSDATVLIHNDETGNERKLVTGADGRFSAPSVPIGTYTISVQHDGFTAQRRTGIPLTVGQSRSSTSP
jgi:hypothetical protein